VHPTHNPVSPAPAEPTPADTLRQAALYLTRHGWAQQDYLAFQPNAEQPFPPACAHGAIAAAAYGHPTIAPHSVDGELYRVFALAVDVFDGYLADLYGDVQHYEGRAGTSWNDEPDRTAEEVIAALNAAADQYDDTHRHLATATGGVR
jgi:hypothetical protein